MKNMVKGMVLGLILLTGCSGQNLNQENQNGPSSNPPIKNGILSYSGIRILDYDTFRRILREDPNIPVMPEDITNLALALYPKRTGRGMYFPSEIIFSNGVYLNLREESNYARDLLYWALQNPKLDNGTRDQVLQIKEENKAPFPSPEELQKLFENKKEGAPIVRASGNSCIPFMIVNSFSSCVSEHFYVQWFTSATPDGIVTEKEVISPGQEQMIYDTVDYLENAWQLYAIKFSKLPKLYPPGGANFGDKKLIQVKFVDLGPYFYGYSEFSNVFVDSEIELFLTNYIELNVDHWKATPGLRKPTSAHELFHRVQYSFGYKSNPDNEKAKWFSEGTASWAEALVWNQVRNEEKMTFLYEFPKNDLTLSGNKAGEFWHYFHKHLGAMNSFMEYYKSIGKIIGAIDLVLDIEFPPNSVFGEFKDYLTLYRRNRITDEYSLKNITNELGDQVSPLEVPVMFRYFDSAINAGSASYLHSTDIDANGAVYIALYVEPDLKGSGKELKLEFLYPSPYNLPEPTPGVEHQYQLIFAKCLSAEQKCGFLDSSGGPSKIEPNIKKENYQVTLMQYPFFATDYYEYAIELDEASKEWDLVYIVVGVDKFQELFTFWSQIQN